MSPNESTQRIERIAQLVLMMLLLSGCWLVLKPFLTAILFALVIAVSTWPLFLWLRKRCRGRRALASLLGCIAVSVAILAPVVLLSLSAANGVGWILDQGREWLSQGPPSPPAWLARIPLFGSGLQDYWRQIAASTNELGALLLRIAEPARGVALLAGRTLGTALVQISVAVFLLFFLYRDGDWLGGRLAEAGERIVGPVARDLLTTAQNTVIAVLTGMLGTALAQAMVAMVGFMLAGVPAPMLLAALLFTLSLIPIGPPLVWIGATLWLFEQGEIGRAIFMGLYGLLVISTVDNIIKPYLISRTSRLPIVFALLGVVGGIIAFGFMGIFIGPTLLALVINLGARWLQRSDIKPAN